MIRFILSLAISSFLLCGPSAAQENAQPFARVEIGAKEVSVGKPVSVTVTLLVPTMFRIQPEFPVFDGVNLIVRSAGPDMMPVTEYIDAAKWTGASQTYWIYPMRPGTYAFEAAKASGVYSDPVDTTSVTAEFDIEPFAFSAVVPAGAETLDPLIVADALTLDQSWEGGVDGLSEGEAIIRTVSASVKGSSALFLPTLIPSNTSELVKVYPQRREVTDSEPGRDTGGQRSESATYVARYGGEVVFPDVQIRWFNSASGKVEAATAKGRTVPINAPDLPVEPVMSRKQAAVLAGLFLCLAVTVWGCKKWLYPGVTSAVAGLRFRWKASEPYAARKVVAAIRAHDLDDVFRSVLVWLECQDAADNESRRAFVSALLKVGREKYGNGIVADWGEVERAFLRMRKATKESKANTLQVNLPELNQF